MTKEEKILEVFHKYVREIHNLKDISGWSSKKTVTESVLNPERTNEQKVLDSLKGRSVQQGDKIYVYFAEERTTVKEPRYKTDRKTKEKICVGEVEKEVLSYPLRLKEDWNAEKPDHSVEKLLKRLYNTLEIFDAVINMDKFTKFHLKGKAVKEKLKEVLDV
jgi:hypothetical protein